MRTVAQSTHGHYLLSNNLFYAPADKYLPTTELYNIVNETLGHEQRILQNGVWSSVTHSPYTQNQGWKIHVSANLQNYKEILGIVSEFCNKQKVNYKFNSDTNMFLFMNSKTTGRGSSGKFITIYPRDTEHFIELMEELYFLLENFEGPYILSDNRYKECKVLYYRYGEFVSIRELNYKNEYDSYIYNVKGEKVKEVRLPYFTLPEGVQDPFEDDNSLFDEDEDELLLNNRYQIIKALHLSASGGVYLALDTFNNDKVVLKEARPYTSLEIPNTDALVLQKNEYEKILYLNSLGLQNIPNLIDYFSEWEHFYLVIKYIEGSNLGPYVTSKNPLLEFKITSEKIQKYNRSLLKIWRNLIEGFLDFYEKGIVFEDLSPNNIIVQDDGTVIFIDLENVRANNEQGFNMKTIGYRNYYDNRPFEQLSYLMFTTILPLTAILENDHNKYMEFLYYLKHEKVISQTAFEFLELLYTNTNPDRDTIMACFNEIVDILNLEYLTHMSPQIEMSELRDELSKPMINFKYNVENFFPGDPVAYETNFYNIAYGITGILYSLKITNLVQEGEKLLEFLKKADLERMNGNLITGSSGIAGALYSINENSLGDIFLAHAKGHYLNDSALDLSYGLAGIGLNCLRAFKATNNNKHLDYAIECGNKIIVELDDFKQEYPSTNKNGEIYLGLGSGYTGMALFFSYLYRETEDMIYKDICDHLIELVLNKLEYRNGDLIGFSRGNLKLGELVYSPYVYDGLVGLAATLMRVDFNKYKNIIEEIFNSIKGNFTAQISYMRGLTGIGDFYIDLYKLTNSLEIKEEINRLNNYLKTFIVEEKYTPGEQLYRNSFDLFTGSAGVLIYLDRIEHLDKEELPESKCPFFIDNYYPIISL